MNRNALRHLQAPLTRALGSSPTRFWTAQSGQALVAVRCYASDRKEPSWSDMVKAGATLISQGVSQIGSTVCKGLAAILPSKREPTNSKPGPLPDDVRRQLFGGGLLGRLVGGMLNSALASIAEQARQAQEAAAQLQSRAQRVVRSSQELQRAVPGQDFTLLPPVSQSAFTTNINGRVQARMRLVMPLVDGQGRLLGQAAVEQVSSGVSTPEGKPPPLEVEVHLASGRTIAIKETESTSRVIDVEWHEVK